MMAAKSASKKPVQKVVQEDVPETLPQAEWEAILAKHGLHIGPATIIEPVSLRTVPNMGALPGGAHGPGNRVVITKIHVESAHRIWGELETGGWFPIYEKGHPNIKER
jgi:hypothetical protein